MGTSENLLPLRPARPLRFSANDLKLYHFASEISSIMGENNGVETQYYSEFYFSAVPVLVVQKYYINENALLSTR